MPAQPRLERFEITTACIAAQKPDSPALIVDDGGRVRRFSFGDLDRLASAAAGRLVAAGGRPGDRVALILPQGVEFAVALLGALRAGLVAVPISTQFGPDGLAYRLADSGSSILVADGEGLEKLAAVRDRLDRAPAAVPAGELANGSGAGTAARSAGGESPALIMYTSGSTGKAKGVLHAHRAVLGQAPGLAAACELSPPGELFWTPSDWPWIVITLLVSWYQGRPVLAAPHRRFDPEWAWSLLGRHPVRVTFMTPTAVRMLAQARRDPAAGLRLVLSGGEPTGEELVNRCRDGLGAELVGLYGQTEADLLVGHRPRRWAVPPNAMGRPYPTHRLEVVSPDGSAVPPGTPGELVLRVPDAAAMLAYWGRPEATGERIHDGRLWTADEVVADGDGNLWFKQRTDDVIKSGGYRVGPGEVEDCLLRHPSVAGAAVIGVPDPVRGQAVKALVQPALGVEPGEQLSALLREHLKGSLAGYQVPRVIEFLAELPMTTTGKVDRAELRRREAGAAG